MKQNLAGEESDTPPATAVSLFAPSVTMTIACAALSATLRLDREAAGVLFAPGLAHLALDDAPPQLVGEGDMILIAPGGTLTHAAGHAGSWLHLAAPRRFLSAALPGRASLVVPRSTMTEALRRHLGGVATLFEAAPDPARAHFLATAVRELLAAATLGHAAPQPRSARRDEEVLERIVAHVDARLGQEVGIAQLCHALGYSRSALYRAAAPAGGLVEVTIQRRLVAVHRALRAPGEHRSIAELARAYGFTDASQFSRRFRRAFGCSAGQVRAGAGDAARIAGP